MGNNEIVRLKLKAVSNTIWEHLGVNKERLSPPNVLDEELAKLLDKHNELIDLYTRCYRASNKI